MALRRAGRTHGIALGRLAELVFRYLTERLGRAPAEIAPCLVADFAPPVEIPEFLRAYAPDLPASRRRSSDLPKRQARHLAHPD